MRKILKVHLINSDASASRALSNMSTRDHECALPMIGLLKCEPINFRVLGQGICDLKLCKSHEDTLADISGDAVIKFRSHLAAKIGSLLGDATRKSSLGASNIKFSFLTSALPTSILLLADKLWRDL